MADSSARSYNYHVSTVKKSNKQQVSLNPDKVPISTFEKTLIFIGSLVVLVIMVLTVSANVTQTKSQQELSEIETKISSRQSSNGDLKQEIGELTSTKRLNKIAHQKGLRIIESNLRNVR